MFQATFVFKPGKIDREFHDRNAEIGKRAAAIEGFLGEESWQSPDGTLRQAVYYWASQEGLTAFVNDKAHREAKKEQGRWYEGYHVIISKITNTYGDGRLLHPTGDARKRGRILGPDVKS